MKNIIVVLLVNLAIVVLCDGKENGNLQGTFGYELIEHRLDHFHETLLERIDKLETVLLGLMQIQITNTRMILDNQSIQTIKSCKEPSTSGLFLMQNSKHKVYCETDSLDGGWLVVQQRVDQKLNFNRSWTEYRNGFGTVGKGYDFWLGLEAIHQITKDGACELAVEMKNRTGFYEYARYSRFEVAREADKYRLTIGGYSGSAKDQFGFHNNATFSTFDRDNDGDIINCAEKYSSGWLFDKCLESIWTLYVEQKTFSGKAVQSNLNYPGGGRWTDKLSHKNRLSYSRMMIRCG